MAENPIDNSPDDTADIVSKADSHTPSLITLAIKKGGDLHIRPVGLERRISADFYYSLMKLSWAKLAVLFFGIFIVFNLVFAILYGFDPGGLAVAHETMAAPPFWRNFFFSVYTVATVGYGNVYPVSTYANTVAVIEITFGIVYFALATGIVFAHFSRPTARMLFSETMVVREIDGVPTLMLRAANQRHNMIYAAQARVSLLVDEEVGGVKMRRFVDLELARASNPAFALTWTIMHAIGADSPLRDWYSTADPDGDQEVIVILSGTDESSGQMIHGRWAYQLRDVRRNARFADIITNEPNGIRSIDYRRFHEVLPG